MIDVHWLTFLAFWSVTSTIIRDPRNAKFDKEVTSYSAQLHLHILVDYNDRFSKKFCFKIFVNCQS